MNNNELIFRLAGERRQRGITLEQTARGIGVTSVALAHWEKLTKSPTLKNLTSWANDLGFEIVLKDKTDRD